MNGSPEAWLWHHHTSKVAPRIPTSTATAVFTNIWRRNHLLGVGQSRLSHIDDTSCATKMLTCTQHTEPEIPALCSFETSKGYKSLGKCKALLVCTCSLQDLSLSCNFGVSVVNSESPKILKSPKISRRWLQESMLAFVPKSKEDPPPSSHGDILESCCSTQTTFNRARVLLPDAAYTLLASDWATSQREKKKCSTHDR